MIYIYVYDRRKYFFLFLKKKFLKGYRFINLNNVEFMKPENFNSSDIGVFVANESNDVVAFYRFRECFENRILICSDKKNILDKYKKTSNLRCLDISRPKKQFYDDLTESFNSLLSFQK